MTWLFTDFQMFRFCRSKCHKAFQKKRNPRKTKWTKAFRKAAGKELTVDSAFEFEKRRNAPVKYNKELWENTGAYIQVLVCVWIHFIHSLQGGSFVLKILTFWVRQCNGGYTYERNCRWARVCLNILIWVF